MVYAKQAVPLRKRTVTPAPVLCRGTNYVMWQPYRPEDRTRRFRFVLQVPDMSIALSSCVLPVFAAPSQWSN